MLKLGINENNEYYVSDLSNVLEGDLDKYQQVAIKLKADGILYDGIILNNDNTLTVTDLTYQSPLLIGTIVESPSAGYYTINYNYPSLDITTYQTNSYSYQKLDTVVLYDDGAGNVTTLKTIWDYAITQMQAEPDYVGYLPYITYMIGVGSAGYFVDYTNTFDSNDQVELKVHSLALQLQSIAAFYATANLISNTYPSLNSDMLGAIYGSLIVYNPDLLGSIYGFNEKGLIEDYNSEVVLVANEISNFTDAIKKIFNGSSVSLSQNGIKSVEELATTIKTELPGYQFYAAGQYSMVIDKLTEAAIQAANVTDFESNANTIVQGFKDMSLNNTKDLIIGLEKVLIPERLEALQLNSLTVFLTDQFQKNIDISSAGQEVLFMYSPDADSEKPFTGAIYIDMHGPLPENENIIKNYPSYLANTIYQTMVKANASDEDFENIKTIIFGNCFSNAVLSDYVISLLYDILIENGKPIPDSISYRYLNNLATHVSRGGSLTRNASCFLYETFVYEIQNQAAYNVITSLYLNKEYQEIVEENIGTPHNFIDVNANNTYTQLLKDCGVIAESTFSNTTNEKKSAQGAYQNYSDIARNNFDLSTLIESIVPKGYTFDKTKTFEERFNSLFTSLRNSYNIIASIDKSKLENEDTVDHLERILDLVKKEVTINPFSFREPAAKALANLLEVDKDSLLDYLNVDKSIFIQNAEEMLKYTGMDLVKLTNTVLEGASNFNPENLVRNVIKSASNQAAFNAKNSSPIDRSISDDLKSSYTGITASGVYLPITGNTIQEMSESIDSNITTLVDLYNKETNVEKKKKYSEDIEKQKSLKENIELSPTKEKVKKTADAFGKAGDILDYYGILISMGSGGFSFSVDFNDPESVGAFCNTVGFAEGIVQVGAELGGIAVGKLVKNMSGISYQGFKVKRVKSMEKMESFALPLDAVLTIGSCYSIFADLDKDSDLYGYMVAEGVLNIASFAVDVASRLLKHMFYPSVILDIIGFVIGLVSTLVGAAMSIVGLDHFSAGEKCKDFFAALFGFNHPGELDNANESLYAQIDSVFDNGASETYRMIICGYFANLDDVYFETDNCSTGLNSETDANGRSCKGNQEKSTIGIGPRDTHNAMSLFSSNFTWDQIKNSGDKNTSLGHSYIRVSSNPNANAIAFAATKNHAVNQDFSNCPYPLTLFVGYLPCMSFYSGEDVAELWAPGLCWGNGSGINDNHGPVTTLTGLSSNMLMIGDDHDDIIANGSYVCQNWGGCDGDNPSRVSVYPYNKSIMPCQYYTKFWQSYYNILAPSNVDTSDSSNGKLILHFQQITDKLTIDLSTPIINMLGDIVGDGYGHYQINNVKSPHTVLRAVTDTNRTLATDFSVVNMIFLNYGSTVTTHNKDLVVQTCNYATVNVQDVNDDSNVVVYAGYNDAVKMTGSTKSVQVIV